MKAKDKIFQVKKTLNLRGNLVSLDTPAVMGILNITPDSFYSLSRQNSEKEILYAAETMLADGALIIDIGGYSSRPNAEDISIEVETERISKAIALVIKEFPEAYISIDTFRNSVASVAIDQGACIINDISGGTLDAKMFHTIAELNVPYIMMHMKGTPQNMTQQTNYKNLLKDITIFFSERVEKLRFLGVKDIILDPGFGFAKTSKQSYEILQNLDYFKGMRLPLLAGLSRKSMIYKTLDITAKEALNGTTALNMVALMNGASMLRVHDVKAAVETVKLYKAIYP
ncbi:dihydropteroate synthase [Roseivirga echinicomitans]|uniref:dihydropteroate synthase n=1 Tax=Roseivirga echinicomitans TaxID=296218 RepID=A0A150XJ75_9BACT|nr:dihydropteroate synthase [Roseivirga echinicomitans]KYG78787.1 dihydropteroate synthase [Roseivirga echinicomitans]